MSHTGHALPHVRQDIDDRASMKAEMLFEQFSGDQESTDQVGSDDGLESFGANGFQRGWILPAGIIHEAVDTAALLQDSTDEFGNPGFVPNIQTIEADGTAVGTNFGGDLLKWFYPTAYNLDVGTQRCEFVGIATSQSAAAARDNKRAS